MCDGNVIKFPGGKQSTVINPDDMLIKTVGELSEAMILGWDKNNEFYISSSHGSIGELLILLELAKDRLVKALTE